MVQMRAAMRKTLSRLLSLKANVIGTIMIAAISSVVTVGSLTMLGKLDLSFQTQSANVADHSKIDLSNRSTSVLDCETGVYSPVQKQCVSEQVFDAEMQRLFAALGLDTAMYRKAEAAVE